MFTVIIFILVLSVLVFVHEFGHFITARKLGVRVTEFGFGFPPRAIGFYKNKQGKWKVLKNNKAYEELEESGDNEIIPQEKSTIYSINWLPLGGFVRIKGQDGDNKEEADSFAAQKVWKRLVILVAGVVMNIILAWGLFSVGYMMGLPQAVEGASSKATVVESRVMIMMVENDSPAAQAGLEAGDIIRSVNGEEINSETKLQDLISASPDEAVSLKITRGDQDLDITATPTLRSGDRAVIGVSIFTSGFVRYPFFSAIIEGAKTTGLVLKDIVVAFGGLITSIFSGQSVADQFAGPVGIASITGEAARLGIIYLIQLAALLSLNLAVLNILPIPALDGGRILFLLIEKIKGGPVKQETENLVHNIGFFLLIALIIFITYKDIARFF